jgi:hypothetical protein
VAEKLDIQPCTFFVLETIDHIFAAFWLFRDRWFGMFPLTKLGWYIKYKHNKLVCDEKGRVWISHKTYGYEEVESPIREEHTMKECSVCRMVKKRSAFIRRTGMKEGVNNFCKKCQNKLYGKS